MKKLFKKLSMLLPLVLLTACGTTQTALAEAPAEPETPTQPEQANIKTYLVLGVNGLYNNEKGSDVESLFIENTITYEAKPGDALPGADKITSTVKDVEFVSWLCYENLGKPTIYDKVPAKEGKILYAFWNYTGTGEVEPPLPPEPPVSEVLWYIVGDGSFVNGSSWDVKSGVPMEVNPKGENEYMKLHVKLEAGDIFKIASTKGQWVEKFETADGSSFASGTIKLISSGMGDGKNAEVVTTGYFDLYLKDRGNDSTIWIQDSVSQEV